jgi:uncharacterized DUF497 family protein
MQHGFSAYASASRSNQAVVSPRELEASLLIKAAVRLQAIHDDWTLANRGLDFEDAALVFDGLTAEVEDKRIDYGELRIICFGLLRNRLVVVGYTPRGAVRHVFSMRKANDREKAHFAPYFGF